MPGFRAYMEHSSGIAAARKAGGGGQAVCLFHVGGRGGNWGCNVHVVWAPVFRWEEPGRRCERGAPPLASTCTPLPWQRRGARAVVCMFPWESCRVQQP